jgi:hypothetical protein
MDKINTAWFNHDILPNEMVLGAIGGKGWPKLEHSEHFKIIDEIISSVNPKNIADIGCGAGEVGRIYSKVGYTGFDLPHIIEKVSKVVNPSLSYKTFDAYNFDYSEFKKYDILICNGFISELTKPFEVINNLLKNTERYLLIHRQYFSNKTEIVEYQTYGNLKTPRCYIDINEFKNMLKHHKIKLHYSHIWGDTVLIEKKP